jgi:hypothetical protein
VKKINNKKIISKKNINNSKQRIIEGMTNSKNKIIEGMSETDKIKLSINGRWNSDISKEFDDKPGIYTVDESQAYSTNSNCGAKDTCVVEVNDKSQARIRMLDRCKSAQGNYSFSDYIGAGETIEKNGCSITEFMSVPGTTTNSSTTNSSTTNSSTTNSSTTDIGDTQSSISDIALNCGISPPDVENYENTPKDTSISLLEDVSQKMNLSSYDSEIQKCLQDAIERMESADSKTATESADSKTATESADSKTAQNSTEDINQVQPYSTDLRTLQIDGNLTMTGQINATSYSNILIAADGKICIGDSCLTKDNIDKIMEMINN